MRNRIIAWGALAGAIVAIFNVWPTIAGLLPGRDPVDRASFTSVVAIAPVRLSEHKGRVGAALQGGESMRTGPDVAATGTAVTDVATIVQAGYDVVLTAQSEPAQDELANEPAVDDGPVAPAEATTESSVDETTSEPTADDTTSEPTADDTTSEPSTPFSEESPDPTRSRESAPLSGLADDVVVTSDRSSRVIRNATDDAFDRLGLRDTCPQSGCAEPTRTMRMMITSQVAVDPQGNDLPIDEVADRVVEFFEQVRTEETTIADGDTTKPSVAMEPVGASVIANLELEGLRGRELRLFWSIFRAGGDGAPLFGRWLGDTPVFRIQPQKDLVSTSVRLWVPLPEASGSYVVQLTLTSDDTPLARQNSNPFE